MIIIVVIVAIMMIIIIMLIVVIIIVVAAAAAAATVRVNRQSDGAEVRLDSGKWWQKRCWWKIPGDFA